MKGFTDTASRNRAIEAALSAHGEVSIPTGSRVNLKNDGVAFLKTIESLGLVTVREIPQDSWGRFATRTFMEGAKPYQVLATPKLAEISLNPNLGGEAGDSDDYSWRIRVSQPELGEILRDEEYAGPLATPGETFRLVLAQIDNVLSSETPGVPSELLTLLPARLRSVVKYDEFKKEWTVVALDVGSPNSDTWNSSNVR